MKDLDLDSGRKVTIGYSDSDDKYLLATEVEAIVFTPFEWGQFVEYCAQEARDVANSQVAYPNTEAHQNKMADAAGLGKQHHNNTDLNTDGD